MANKSFKVFWLIIGFLCLALGTIGVFLPVLPTVPFYLVTAFAFAKSSERLHNWFINTKLYKKNLESFVALSNLSNNLNQTIASGNRVLNLLKEKPLVEEVKDGKSVSFEGVKTPHALLGC